MHCDAGEEELLRVPVDVVAGRCGMRVDSTKAYFGEVRATSQDEPCFVISAIGGADSSVRRHADYVLDHIIAPALAHCGYRPIRCDNIDKPGSINDEVIERILTAPLAVADLTTRNPNVYYELALRHATHKPVVQLLEQNTQLPFDVEDMRTVEVRFGAKANLETARNQLIREVTAATAGMERGDLRPMRTPVPWTLRP